MAKISKRSVDALMAAGKPGLMRDDVLKGFAARLNRDGSVTYLFEYRAGRCRGGAVAASLHRPSRHVHADHRPRSGRGAAISRATGRGPGPRSRQGSDHPHRAAVRDGLPGGSRDDGAGTSREGQGCGRERSRTTVRISACMSLPLSAAVASTRSHRAISSGFIKRSGSSIRQRRTAWSSSSHPLASRVNASRASSADNPARGVRAFKEMKRERYLTPEEMMRLGAAIHEAETTGVPMNIDPDKPSSKHVRKNPEKRLVCIDPFAAAALPIFPTCQAFKARTLASPYLPSGATARASPRERTAPP